VSQTPETQTPEYDDKPLPLLWILIIVIIVIVVLILVVTAFFAYKTYFMKSETQAPIGDFSKVETLDSEMTAKSIGKSKAKTILGTDKFSTIAKSPTKGKSPQKGKTSAKGKTSPKKK
jgi:hypothetical protein